MKFLIINYEYPPLGGGAGNATQAIAKELVALGHEPVVLTAGFGDLPQRESPDGFPVIRVRSRRARVDRSGLLEMLDFVRVAHKALPALVAEFSFDHSIAFFAVPSGLLSYRLKKRFDIPYTVSLRGGDVPGFLPKNLHMLHALSMPLTHLVWKHADRIIANSNGLTKLAEKTASPLGKRVECIPNGVDIQLYHPSLAKRTSQPFKLLFVGRLTEQKGVTYLLSACAQLMTGSINQDAFQVLIVGDGPLRASLEAEALSLGLSKVVSFLGWKSRSDIIETYRDADAFVLPSFEEGMPNVVLEAMASGLPIIATDVKGNDELVENGVNGFLYTDHKELPDCIAKLVEDTVLATRFGEASRKKAEQWGWKKVAEAYARV